MTWMLLLTQLSFMLTLVFLPLSLLSVLYGKLTGQIVFSVKESPSLFELKKPNPAVKEPNMPWLKEQMRLLGLPTTEIQKETKKENVFEKTKIVKLAEMNEGQFKNFLSKEVEKLESLNEKEKDVKLEEKKRGRGRPKGSVKPKPEPIQFQPVRSQIKFKVDKDVKVMLGNIPVILPKGTELTGVIPGVEIIEKKEKVKKKGQESLETDKELGLVSERSENAW